LYYEHRLKKISSLSNTQCKKCYFVADPNYDSITTALPYRQNLAQSAEKFDLLFNSMDAGYIILDETGIVLYFNSLAEQWTTALRITPLKRYENILDGLDNEKRMIVVGALAKVMSGEQISYEYVSPHDGSPHWYSTKMFPLKNAEGLVEGVCIHLGDINENKQNELALKRSNERYQYVSHVTSDAIYDLDLLNNSLYFNSTYKKLFGTTETDFTDDLNAWEKRIHEEDRKRVVDSLNDLLTDPSRHYFEEEYRYLRYDGSYAYVLDRGHVMYNNEKVAVRMVGAMQDITNRKLYEIERERITTDLIQRNQDLEQFAFIVSHNLRSHIANILGLSELVNSGLLGAEEKNSIFQTLNISAKKLDSVIKDLSLILQVKRDISEKKQKIQFAELVHDVQVSLHAHIEKEQAEIITNFRSADSIYTVKSYLYSVIHNLISNSLKYRKSNDHPVIKIYSETSDHAIVIHYKDNGLGIDMHANGHNVFGLYKRFHHNIEGKGMGLFMVKTQVEALGGEIALRSSPNEGVEFTIRFKRTE
jgi:PAS domain S-box-containing protein